MPETSEPYLLLGGLLIGALVLRTVFAVVWQHRLSARQKAYREYMRSEVWR